MLDLVLADLNGYQVCGQLRDAGIWTPILILTAMDGELRLGRGSVGDLQIDTRTTILARDQSSFAALNISGLVRLDLIFALSMAAVAIAIFVFGLLLQRRREYINLRVQGLEPRTIRFLIAAEASTVALVFAATVAPPPQHPGWSMASNQPNFCGTNSHSTKVTDNLQKHRGDEFFPGSGSLLR